jgi:fructokinase
VKRVIRIGIDFGGTKIEAAALDEGGGFLARERVPNPRVYEQSVRATRDLLEKVEQDLGARGTVGVAIPGSISPLTGRIRNANSTWLNDRPLREDMEAALGRPLRLVNDADCLAISEAADGAGAGAASVFAVIVGTGCGAGVVVNGRLQEGGNGVAGEWGHAPLPWPDAEEYAAAPCWCGRVGCLETWISGTGFERHHARTTGQVLRSQEIVDAARAGEPGAAASLDRYIDRLARGLGMVCSILDPHVIVLGGGMSNIGELYDQLPARVARHIFADAFETPILPARWGDSSGVRGAAWLWDAPA